MTGNARLDDSLKHGADGKPLISVVIPSYNSARFVVQAVDSALQQTYSPIEVIVVDDGSTDDTRQRLQARNDRIRYIFQANGGVSKARNRGIKEARGRFIAFLDADDQWLPQKLQKQWERLQADPEAMLVHADVFNLIDATNDVVYENQDRGRFSGDCYTEFVQRNGVITSTVLINRKCLDAVGVFDEDIRRASVEDMDLWFRIARRFRFSYVDEPLMLYRVHPDSATRNQRVMLEGDYYVLAKALREDPGLIDAFGRKRLWRRLSGLAFDAGYANVDADDLLRGRRYFGSALRYAPWSPTIWTYFVSTFLPARAYKALRFMKQRLVGVESVRN